MGVARHIGEGPVLRGVFRHGEFDGFFNRSEHLWFAGKLVISQQRHLNAAFIKQFAAFAAVAINRFKVSDITVGFLCVEHALYERIGFRFGGFVAAEIGHLHEAKNPVSRHLSGTVHLADFCHPAGIAEFRTELLKISGHAGGGISGELRQNPPLRFYRAHGETLVRLRHRYNAVLERIKHPVGLDLKKSPFSVTDMHRVLTPDIKKIGRINLSAEQLKGSGRIGAAETGQAADIESGKMK